MKHIIDHVLQILRSPHTDRFAMATNVLDSANITENEFMETSKLKNFGVETIKEFLNLFIPNDEKVITLQVKDFDDFVALPISQDTKGIIFRKSLIGDMNFLKFFDRIEKISFFNCIVENCDLTGSNIKTVIAKDYTEINNFTLNEKCCKLIYNGEFVCNFPTVPVENNLKYVNINNTQIEIVPEFLHKIDTLHAANSRVKTIPNNNYKTLDISNCDIIGHFKTKAIEIVADNTNIDTIEYVGNDDVSLSWRLDNSDLRDFPKLNNANIARICIKNTKIWRLPSKLKKNISIVCDDKLIRKYPNHNLKNEW